MSRPITVGSDSLRRGRWPVCRRKRKSPLSPLLASVHDSIRSNSWAGRFEIESSESSSLSSSSEEFDTPTHTHPHNGRIGERGSECGGTSVSMATEQSAENSIHKNWPFPEVIPHSAISHERTFPLLSSRSPLRPC